MTVSSYALSIKNTESSECVFSKDYTFQQLNPARTKKALENYIPLIICHRDSNYLQSIQWYVLYNNIGIDLICILLAQVTK